MAEPELLDEQHELDRTHHTRGRPYVLALIGLILLTALSFGMHYTPLGGALGALVALLIAGAKVTIVGVIFMELRESLPATRMIAIVTVTFVALLCLGIIGDVAFR
jgi:caa(3)-type oxidase subunit IV